MQSYRNNPDSDTNTKATAQHLREVFALQMKRRKSAATHTASCPSCESEIEVEIEPYIPARTYGDPNDCYPAEGGTVEPDNCPWCDGKLDTGLIYKEWEDERRDHISDYKD